MTHLSFYSIVKMFIYFTFILLSFPLKNQLLCFFSLPNLFAIIISKYLKGVQHLLQEFHALKHNTLLSKKKSNSSSGCFRNKTQVLLWESQMQKKRLNPSIFQNILLVQSCNGLHFHTFWVPSKTWLQFNALKSNMEVEKIVLKSQIAY